MNRLDSPALGRLVSAVFDSDHAAGARLLAPLDFVNATAAFRDLARIIEPLGPGERAEALADVLLTTLAQSADPDMALANWERFFTVTFGRATLASFLVLDPKWTQTISRLFGHSQYLADILMLNPEYFDWLQTRDVDRSKSLEEFESEMTGAIALFSEEESRRNALLRYHRREILRIGLRDLMQWADLEGITAEISDLAQASVRLGLALVENRLIERYGKPLCGDSSSLCGFGVIAMGKFGGRELNYSSDVDLIFIYGEPGKTLGRDEGGGHMVNSISNQDFFTKLGQGLIDFLSRPGPEGYFYRVDMRLRPDGIAGALVHSFAACQNYYLSRARIWEKIALLKARGIAGDTALLAQFELLETGFVYAPTSPVELLAEVARLKSSIDHEVAVSAHSEREIKRGPGGIREIEFMVTALEILYGANRLSLRCKSTLEALKALEGERVLSNEDAGLLETAYRFFRRVEHALQFVAWRQTHLIPEEERELAALARRVGVAAETRLEAAERFLAERRRLADSVHVMFNDMFRSTSDERTGLESAPLRALDRAVPLEEAARVLAHWRLRSHQTIEELRRLLYGSSTLFISSEGQRLFEQMLPDVLEWCRETPWPENAIHYLEAFVQACGNATGYYGLFDANRPILNLLLRLFGSSRTLSERLIANPGWFDLLVMAETFEIAPSSMRDQGPDLAKRAPADAAGRLRALRDFAFVNMLRIGTRYIVSMISAAEMASLLSALADACLETATLWAIEDVFGDGPGAGDEMPAFAVLGLGKLGRRELTFQSDLDVVFVADPSGQYKAKTGPHGQMLYTRLAERLIHYLTDASTGPAVFRVDARLRPQGASSSLVTSLERLRRHFAAHPEVWEIQTYLGARVVAGDRALGDQALGNVMGAVAGLGDPARVAEAVRSMRARLEATVELPPWASADFKRGPGGLVDLEFLAQYLQIIHHSETPDLAAKAPSEVFEIGERAEWLATETAAQLIEDYDFLRALETDVRLVLEARQTCFPLERARLDALVRAPGRAPMAGEVLRSEFESRIRRVRKVFERIVC